jgi:hypothetical protein
MGREKVPQSPHPPAVVAKGSQGSLASGYLNLSLTLASLDDKKYIIVYFNIFEVFHI